MEIRKYCLSGSTAFRYSRNHDIPMIDDNFFIVFVGDKVSKDMFDYQTEFDDEHITIGPWIIGEGLWKNGTFFTVGHCEITEKEKQLDYGFFKFKRYPNGYIVDVDGNVLDKEPKYLEHGAYNTIHGIEVDVREALILHPEIMGNVK